VRQLVPDHLEHFPPRQRALPVVGEESHPNLLPAIHVQAEDAHGVDADFAVSGHLHEASDAPALSAHLHQDHLLPPRTKSEPLSRSRLTIGSARPTKAAAAPAVQPASL